MRYIDFVLYEHCSSNKLRCENSTSTWHLRFLLNAESWVLERERGSARCTCLIYYEIKHVVNTTLNIMKFNSKGVLMCDPVDIDSTVVYLASLYSPFTPAVLRVSWEIKITSAEIYIPQLCNLYVRPWLLFHSFQYIVSFHATELQWKAASGPTHNGSQNVFTSGSYHYINVFNGRQ